MIRPLITTLLFLMSTSWVSLAGGAHGLRFDFERSHGLPVMVPLEPPCVEDGALAVTLERDTARPQDRWLEVQIEITPQVTLEETRLEASVYVPGTRDPLASVETVPSRPGGRLAIDLRTPGVSTVDVLVELFERDQRTGSARLTLAAASVPEFSEEQRIPIRLDIPESLKDDALLPVTFGVPFPPGTLWDGTPLRLVRSDGREYPTQQNISARWAHEGSIQWVRFDALVDGTSEYFVEKGPPVASPSAPVVVREMGDAYEISTGATTYRVGLGPALIEEVRLQGQTVARGGERGLYVIDQQGRVASSSADGGHVEIEADGPVAACLRIEAPYRTADHKVLARHITRIEVFAGQAAARVTHTLVLTEDTSQIWFREIGWDFAVGMETTSHVVFNVDRGNPAKTLTHDLVDKAGVAMLQSDHFRFGAGENRFQVATTDGRVLHTGAECGDWVLLHDAAQGFLVACRETARQHPKEFAAARGRLTLRLFSPNAGEELDFRTASILRKLNLPEEERAPLENIASNAAGWAKTHELLLAPLAGAAGDMQTEAARLSGGLSQPAYALADPAWIAASHALGPIHPRDTQRFPDLEKVIENRFNLPGKLGHEPGHYGFMDYFAGPTYGRIDRCVARRYRLTYGLRSNVWLLYARSGDRTLRDFAEGTNKAFLDNYLTHWDVPGKVRGLYTGTRRPHSRLPLYWERGYAFNLQSSTDLNQFLWLYHLTGYRRAADAVLAFNEGLKEAWTPEAPPADARVLMMFRVLAQSYGFTWDPEIRALAQATFASFYDPEAELLLNKHRPGGSVYKTNVDVRALIDAWNIFGRPVYREAALAVARHWWLRLIGTNPVTYMNPLGIIGSFLYEETNDPSIPGGLEHQLLRAGGYLRPGPAMSVHAAVFEGLPYAMAVRTGLPEEKNYRWITYHDNDQPTAIVLKKNDEHAANLFLQSVPRPAFGRAPQLATAGIEPRTYNPLYTLTLRSAGAAQIQMAKDADGGAYVITPAGHGEHFLLSCSTDPLVLYAPNSWTLPDLTPARRIYFQLLENEEQPQIFLEGRARVYDPSGAVYGAEEGISGWIELPSERLGLWSFLPLENKSVSVSNIPPFFAMNGPESFFLPPGLE